MLMKQKFYGEEEMKKSFVFLLVVLMLVCAVFFTACSKKEAAPAAAAPAQEVFNLRLAHLTPETEAYHLAAVRFKNLIEERSKGRIKITIYPAGQLGFDREVIESLQIGVIDLGMVTTAPLANFVPAFAAFDMPWMFRDWDHVEAALKQPFIKELYDSGYEKGLVPMAMLPRGFRITTNSVRPINSAADFKGIKMRVLESPVYVTTFEALGANVTAMSWGEVFTALQQGAIDACEQPAAALFNERIFEVQKYLTFTNHIFAFATFVSSRALYDKLPKDLKDLMRSCAEEALSAQGKQERENEAVFAQKLQDKGLIANKIDTAPLRKIAQVTYDQFAKTAAPRTVEYVGLIEKTK